MPLFTSLDSELHKVPTIAFIMMVNNCRVKKMERLEKVVVCLLNVLNVPNFIQLI